MSETVPEHVAEAVEEGVPKRLHRRGRFIPAAKEHLIALLAEHVAPDATAAAQFREVCRLLDDALHREARERALRLKENYATFDPDTDAVTGRRHDPDEVCRRSEAIFTDVQHLTEKANYPPMARDDVDAA